MTSDTDINALATLALVLEEKSMVGPWAAWTNADGIPGVRAGMHPVARMVVGTIDDARFMAIAKLALPILARYVLEHTTPSPATGRE